MERIVGKIENKVVKMENKVVKMEGIFGNMVKTPCSLVICNQV
jgi:hypothetical protein